MTQEVQPLTWQKRTNLEEHQQFFSKINEIIANLAPTVDEAEAAIAQATQAVASANAAIATANAASASADAASQEAQTAANTVAGYNTRLIAVEDESSGNTSNIIDLQDRMGTAEGNIASLGTRMSNAESKNSQQDNAIAALQTADGQNVKIDRINEYAVGLTGNQGSISGYKTFTKYIAHVESGNQYGFVDKRTDINITTLTGTAYKNVLKVMDADDNNLTVLEVRGYANGTTAAFIKVRNSDGSTKTVTLATGDVI